MTLLAILPSLCTNNLKGLGATLTINEDPLGFQFSLMWEDVRCAHTQGVFD